MDRRDHVGATASLLPFFAPKSIAVIGAPARRGTIGGELFRNVLQADFTGAAYPVNRSGDSVGGVAGYASIAKTQVLTFAAVPVNIGGSADCGGPVATAGDVSVITVPAGYYDVDSTFVFVKN